MFDKLEKKFQNWLRGKLALNTFRGNLKLTGELSAKLIKGDGTVKNYGVISRRLVTTAFCEYLVDNLIAEESAFGDFKFHGSGTGSTGANISDTVLEFEVDTRGTGTQVEDTSVIYKTIGTQTYDATLSITEAGVFNIVTGGVLMDRHTFTAIGVEATDSIEWTYKLSVVAGG